MNIRTNFGPGDVVWLMDCNEPVQKKIICTRISLWFENGQSIIAVHHSFDEEHKFFTPESNLAATREQLKQKIFG